MPRQRPRRDRGTGSVVKLPGSRNGWILYRVGGRQIRERLGSQVKQVALRLLPKRLGEREQGLAPVQEIRRLRYETVRQMLPDDYALNRRRSRQAHADGSPKLDALPALDRFFAGRSVVTIATADLRPFILLLYWSECRVGEARKIQWSQVDPERPQIILHHGRTRSAASRVIPLPDELATLLQDTANRQGPMFYQGEFQRSWMTACCKAGLGERVKKRQRLV